MTPGIGAVYTPPELAERLVSHTLRGVQPHHTVLDPACGDGALLAQAYHHVVRARVAAGQSEAQARRETVQHNLFGVDLDPQAVDAARARLAALSGAQPTGIRVGNALLEPPPGPARFDRIVANPPYLRIQALRRLQPDWVAPLSRFRAATGSYDVSVIFIERALDLLAPQGYMGFLAPNAWLRSEYGRGLRALLQHSRQLERFDDYAWTQKFAGRSTYVALQYFTQSANSAVAHAAGPSPYEVLPPVGAWLLLPADEQRLMTRLSGLPALSSCANVIVGVQTSADRIYHLQRLAPGRYQTRDGDPVSLEDHVMKPLLSGRHVRALEPPGTDTWLLLPYRGAQLMGAGELAAAFPNAWAYLQRNEPTLRARERGKMNRDDRWWAYNYPKNLTRQPLPKLLVPRLLRQLGCALDKGGDFYLDNVDVGGVIPHDSNPIELAFLAAVLNSPVADFVWRRLARPFRGGYLSANKQFLAPLPIPVATASERRRIAGAIGARVNPIDDLIGLYRLSPAERSLIDYAHRGSAPAA